MATRPRSLGRHPSAIALLWIGSLTLGLADVVYAGLLPAPAGARVPLAIGTAAASGLVLAVAAVLAVTRPGRPDGRPVLRRWWVDEAIRMEAAWGIAQIEAWLERQSQTHDG